MGKKIFSMLTLMASLSGTAQTSYQTSLIPDSLRTHTHIVVRDFDASFIVSSSSKAMYKVHEVITALDKAGRPGLNFASYSSSFQKLDFAEIHMYDSAGKLVKDVRQKDMDVSGFGMNLVDDAKYTFYAPTAPTYPLTVVIDYTMVYKGLVSYPSFSIDNTERSIEHASYTVSAPKSVGVRYKNYNVALEPARTIDPKSGADVYTWTAEGIRARRSELNAASGHWRLVMLAPGLFSMDDKEGNMSTWQQFGAWMYGLNSDRWTLPEASKPFYRNLVAGAATNEAKARILYAYLQRNFRYVSIQLGIGGFRSFPAQYTEQNKYGDCKALSCYMKACLEAVGIKSYMAVINAGYAEAPVDPDFCSNRFNHAILCIPGKKDSTWLECTSNKTDFGILGDFTEDRNALLITENGGVLVRTPPSMPEENTTQSYTHVLIQEDGSGTADLSLASKGAFKFERSSILQDADHEAQRKYLLDNLEYPEPDSFALNVPHTDTPVLVVTGHLSYTKIPDVVAGRKMFLIPRMGPLWDGRLASAQNRTTDYHFNYPFVICDTTCYQLPAGYTAEQLPKGKSLVSPQAVYTTHYWFDPGGNRLFSCATLRLTSRNIPAADYAAVRQVFVTAAEDRMERIVISKP